jgi:hypothetical protein
MKKTPPITRNITFLFLAVAVVLTITTYLPNYIHHRYQYELAIQFPIPSSTAIYYAGQGIGVYIFNTGSGYNAYEAACLISFKRLF